MGFPAMLIAERIGDTVEMINNTYGHLYPNRHEELADRLEQLVSKHKVKARNPLILKVSGFCFLCQGVSRSWMPAAAILLDGYLAAECKVSVQ